MKGAGEPTLKHLLTTNLNIQTYEKKRVFYSSF